ncbi:MAG: hypothetical protein JO197_19295 [Acidobacteria bacterium]|nr:hypothetical protein [Acidobacteriota bacterium]MBV9477047.1 hypothetical protein [Acidobacteriota bacterium]
MISPWLVVILALTALGITAVAAFAVLRYSPWKRRAMETEELRIDRIREDEPYDRRGYVRFRYELLREYHAWAFAQADLCFWFATAFAGLGIAVMLAALFAFRWTLPIYLQPWPIAALGAGLVVELVAVVFLTQSGSARKLMIGFFERFRDVEESLRLVNAVSDPILQSRLQILLSLHFADVETGPTFLNALRATNRPCRVWRPDERCSSRVTRAPMHYIRRSRR